MTAGDLAPHGKTPLDVAGRVRGLLASSSLSQRSAAQIMGMDPTKLSKGLANKRRFQIAELSALAAACGAELAWLVDGGSATPAETASEHAEYPAIASLSDPTSPDQRILAAAGVLIATRGYHNVRVQDIAAACDFSTAAVHYHFDSKDELLARALEHAIRADFRRNSVALESIKSSLEKIQLFVDMQIPDNAELRNDWSLWLQFWVERITNERLRTVSQDIHSEWVRSFERLVERGLRYGEFVAVDPTKFAVKFTALADGLALRALAQDANVSPAVMREVLHDMVITELTSGTAVEVQIAPSLARPNR